MKVSTLPLHLTKNYFNETILLKHLIVIKFLIVEILDMFRSTGKGTCVYLIERAKNTPGELIVLTKTNPYHPFQSFTEPCENWPLWR